MCCSETSSSPCRWLVAPSPGASRNASVRLASAARFATQASTSSTSRTTISTTSAPKASSARSATWRTAAPRASALAGMPRRHAGPWSSTRHPGSGSGFSPMPRRTWRWTAAHEYVGCFPHIPTVQADVAALRPSVNAVIVSCHTGAQFNPYPAPETRELARAAIHAGASVFLGHHPHVPQGYERIDHGIAVYSLGNFVASSRREETRRTFFVRIALDGDRVASHEIVPCSIGDDGRTVVADGDLGRSISAEIERLTDDIAQGRSDDLHFDIARSRMGSQYVATWLREFRRGGPGVILRKLRNLRPYHATLVARMLGIKR